MAITPPPTPPNTGDPAFLEQRADAFFGWFPTFVSQFNAELPFISSKGWATYGGSANAITLSAGFVSLLRGTQVRFRATATNTGITTINLDGLGARPCRTITGLALPAGYIRTDADTVATYNGTDWIVDRQIERGSNTNGDFVRFADGSQICTCTALTSTEGAVGAVFPAAFAAVPRASTAIRLSSTIPLSAVITALSTTGASVSAYTAASGTRLAASVDIIAIGRWY